jgi:hypothetical protein
VPGSVDTQVTGINSEGEIVGYYDNAYLGNHHGFIYTAGTFITYDVPGAAETFITGINSNEQIVGYYYPGTSVRVQHGFVTQIACFAAGTHIHTSQGAIPVESLCEGTVLPTYFSTEGASINWIGYRRVSCRQHPNPEVVWPVRVAAGAFGNNLPLRDLWLSPDHAVFVDDVLIPVKHLVNGMTITQEARDEVTYYHIELDNHDVLLAEGLPCESYLDTGDRWRFANGGESVLLRPGFPARTWEAKACAPIVMTGPTLMAVRAELLQRAVRIANQPRDSQSVARAA